MDRNGDIRLDPDVLESREGSGIPLSDLYELPVFAPDTEQEAGRLYAEEMQMLERIRREVFDADCRGNEAVRLAGIRSRLFDAAPEFTMREAGRESAPGQEAGLPAEMSVIGCIAVILGISRLVRMGRRRRMIGKIKERGNDSNILRR